MQHRNNNTHTNPKVHVWLVLSGPNSVPTIPHPISTGFPTDKAGCTNTRKKKRRTELVSVPPMSITAAEHSPTKRQSTTKPWGLVTNKLLRKEVIQPHLPVRLPCYDFVPIADPTFDSSLPLGVGPPASGVTDFRDVTGGVYKARERIHRSVADLRLLATPTSWGRVADPNPN